MDLAVRAEGESMVKVVLALLGLVAACQINEGVARAQTYLTRPISLHAGQLRIDVGPSDYGYMDHGGINGSYIPGGVDNGARGGRFVDRPGDTAISLGLGMAYGVTDRLEVGGLVIPLQLSPRGDMGDVELYGRFGMTRGLALQATLQLPTHTELGVGLGIPFKVALGAHRLEMGVELEFIFEERESAHLDVPFALQFALSKNVFAGFRSGIYFERLEDIAVNLGVQGGVTIANAVDLTASFNIPKFLWTGPGDSVRLDGYQLILGLNIYVN